VHHALDSSEYAVVHLISVHECFDEQLGGSHIDAGLITDLFLKTPLTLVKYNAYCLWDDVVLFLGFQVSNLDRSIKVGTIC